MGAYDDILNQSQTGAYDDILAAGKEKPKKKGSTVKDIVGGLARSGMGIASNLLRPIEAAIPGGADFDSGHAERMARVQGRYVNQGYDPESIAFQGGKLAGDIAMTAPIGGGLAKLPMLAKAPQLANALRTGGLGKNIALIPRLAGGAATGAATSGAVDLDNTGSGAMFGAALPVGFKGAAFIGENVVKPGARRVMQSAVKPTIAQLRKGEAKTAIDTLLDYGINPTQRGVEKLRMVLDDLNAQIAGKVAGSKATIQKNDVLGYLGDVNRKFANQVSPTSDLAAISGVADDFIGHPLASGQTLTVPLAQNLKQGTYKALKGKYGEAGSAATEAQKALARGLKEEIGKAVPDIVPLNAEEARLLTTLGVAERRALMELNKNPVGLSALAGNPYGFAAFMADRSAAFKAIVARMMNQAAKSPDVLSNVAANPVVRAGLLSSQQD